MILSPVRLYASDPWNKNSAHWTSEDAQRILAASPWAKAGSALFTDVLRKPPPGPVPGAAQAGMAGPRGPTGERWDGGVGKDPGTGVPSLPVTVRWESALPVREAILRLEQRSALYGDAEVQKDYVIAVLGLVPGGRYRKSGQLSTQSQSDESVDARDPEQVLEGLMTESRLRLRGRKPIAPEDVKLDAASGTLYLFFPRSETISVKDKEIVFSTRFGSLTVQKQFRLKEMSYQGKLEL